MGGTVAAILLQLAVTFIYQVQAQLQLQLMVLRYILFPVGLLVLVTQVQTQQYFSSQTAAALIVLLLLIAYFVNFIIHSYSSFKVSRSFEKASNYLVLTDALLALMRLPA